MTNNSPCLENLKISLLVKLGSLIVHFEEYASNPSSLDLYSIISLLSDPEIKSWMEEMNELALLPIKR